MPTPPSDMTNDIPRKRYDITFRVFKQVWDIVLFYFIG